MIDSVGTISSGMFHPDKCRCSRHKGESVEHGNKPRCIKCHYCEKMISASVYENHLTQCRYQNEKLMRKKMGLIP